MEELSKNIISLLAENDCVILPGIGGFIAHYQPASYNADSGEFAAPLRTIGFNRALTMNDGLVIQAYMQSHGLNYPDASKLAYKDISKLRRELIENGRAEFEGLGVLTKTSDGTYTFEPAITKVATPGLFGLPNVKAPLLYPINTVAVPNKSTEVVEPAQETTPKGRKYTFTFKRQTIHNVAAVAAAVILSLAISTPTSDTAEIPAKASAMIGAIDFKSVAPQPAKATTTAPQTATAPHRDEPAESKTESPAAAPKQPATPTEASTPSHYYTIVLASAVSKPNAEAFVAALKARGFNKAEVYKSKSMRRVVYSRFATESQAQAALNEITANDFAADAWVMKIKN